MAETCFSHPSCELWQINCQRLMALLSCRQMLCMTPVTAIRASSSQLPSRMPDKVLRLPSATSRMALTGSKQQLRSAFALSCVTAGAVRRRRCSSIVAMSAFLSTWRLLGSLKTIFRTCTHNSLCNCCSNSGSHKAAVYTKNRTFDSQPGRCHRPENGLLCVRTQSPSPGRL